MTRADGRPLGEGGVLPRQRLKPLVHGAEGFVVEARAHLGHVYQLAVAVQPQVERPEKGP